MPALVNITPELVEFARHDEDYALWLQYISDLCERFLSIRFIDILDSVVLEEPPYEVFEGGFKPESYFKEVICHVLECDYGADHIEVVVHDNIMWGTTRTEVY